VVLSPDHSEPSLTATASFGVRTFLASCRSTKRDRLIHFSPQYCLFHRFVNVPIGHPSQFAKLTVHVNNTIRVELSQQTHGARALSFSPLIRYTPSNWRTNSWESLCTTIFFRPSRMSASRPINHIRRHYSWRDEVVTHAIFIENHHAVDHQAIPLRVPP
jgi:hypothetical protein